MAVHKRSDNQKWYIQFTYRHLDGRKEVVKRTSPINTKRAAEQYEQLLKQKFLEQDQNPRTQAESPTFQEYAETFMRNVAKQENKLSEYRSKESILTHHLLPVFGKLKLDEITRDIIKGYRTKKLDQGYSAKSVNNQLAVFSRILAEAVGSGHLNFVPRVKNLRLPPQEFDFLTFEEADLLVEKAEGSWKDHDCLGSGYRASARGTAWFAVGRRGPGTQVHGGSAQLGSRKAWKPQEPQGPDDSVE